MVTELTARNLTAALAEALAQTETNGLEKYAGTWTEEEFQEFQRNTACFAEIDEN